MDLQQFEESIQNPEPVYLVVGGDDYVRNRVWELCRAQVPESARSFDWGVLDLEKESSARLWELSRTPPWLAPRRWLYARGVQWGDPLVKKCVEDPFPRVVLVLEVKGSLSGWPSDLPRVERGRVSPSAWIRQRVEQEGFRMEPEAERWLLELVGEDVGRLDAELEKLFLWGLQEKQISLDAVLAMAFQTRDFEVFALIEAMAGGQAERALGILSQLLERGMAPAQVLGLLYWNFKRLLVARELLEAGRRYPDIVRELKIWSFKGRERQIRACSRAQLVRILERIVETDLLTKTTGLPERLHLERLVIDSCRTISL